MSFDDDDIDELGDSVYFESFSIDELVECLLPRVTHSYTTELIIEVLCLVGECDELFPPFSVWCVPVHTVVRHGQLLSYWLSMRLPESRYKKRLESPVEISPS